MAVGHRVKMLQAIENLDSKEEVITEPSAKINRAPAGKEELELRQLTVMCFDLVGSTKLSRQLDPEELREINRRYQDVAKAAIERYEGHIAR